MQCILPTQPEYPPLLLETAGYPSQLYCLGSPEVLSSALISVVGSRAMSNYAQSITDMLLRPLICAGVGIVSGLAYGADAAAHQCLVRHGGRGVAVLAHGLDSCYPESHTKLRDSLLALGGAVISEYPPSTPPLKHHFLARNRIVAGLSPLLLILEAGARSGTFATARAALEAGRDVAVVPSDITRSENEGGLQLLKQGAQPICSASDIAALLGVSIEVQAPPSLTNHEQALYNQLRRHPATAAVLAKLLSFSLVETRVLLGKLELAGYITYRNGVWLVS